MKRNHLLLAVILLGLFSCSSTHKVATWKSPDFEAKPYKKLLVWGLSDNVSVRATVEDEVAYFLNVKGIASVSGSDIAPPDRKALPNNIDDAKAVLEKNGFDCVMTMGLIDKKEKNKIRTGKQRLLFSYGIRVLWVFLYLLPLYVRKCVPAGPLRNFSGGVHRNQHLGCRIG